MTAKMEEGFRKEELSDNRQREMKAGVKNEANAQQIVQNDSQAIKDEIRQLESGSGSGNTVGSVASAAVGRRAMWYVRKYSADRPGKPELNTWG